MRALLASLLMSIIFQLGYSQEYGSKSQFKVNRVISFGATKSEIISILGRPTREQKDYNEMDEIDVLIMWYRGCKLFIEEEKLVSFEFYDPTLYIQYGSYKFRVNYLISVFKPAFPISYDQRHMNLDNPDFPPTMVINLKDIANSTEEVPIDEFIYIEFSSSSLRITSISQRTY